VIESKDPQGSRGPRVVKPFPNLLSVDIHPNLPHTPNSQLNQHKEKVYDRRMRIAYNMIQTCGDFERIRRLGATVTVSTQ